MSKYAEAGEGLAMLDYVNSFSIINWYHNVARYRLVHTVGGSHRCGQRKKGIDIAVHRCGLRIAIKCRSCLRMY